jgi:choline dehydrogenase-like flavoprotein
MAMMMKLYKEGGLQQTKQFTMTLAQGECVGGTTVINNAVCFKMPDNIKTEWQNKYGIDLSGLDAEYARLEEELSIVPLDGKGVNRISRALFEKGVAGVNGGLPATDRLTPEYPVHVNHRNTTGDGNWNLGNKRMQKRSMLETFLPWSEARGVKIVSNLMAARFVADENRRATEVHLLNTDGTFVCVKVKKAVLVAGGAVASSHFLMRSGVPNKNVGKALSCNFAFPVTLDFDLPDGIRAYDGDQITMAALDPRQRAAFETYFNPPATFSITSVPFFFDRRDAVMDRYKHLLNLGTLVGSEAKGVVLPKADLFNGQAFSWELGDTDIANIKYALSTLVQIGRHAGATKAILPTRPGIELDLRKPDSEAEFIKALDNYPLQITDLLIGSAHPQGGNLMAGAKAVNAGIGRVVDETFRVEGYSNVFVVDASIFPTSITVNPQWTIMALSSLAAKSVLKYCR